MITYKNINPQFESPIDLNILGNTLTRVHEGNIKVLEEKGKIEEALAKVPVGDDPDAQAYVQGLTEKLNKSIEDNTMFGQPYYGMNKIMETFNEIKADKGLNGRMNYYLNREAWKKGIDARNDIDEDTKNYYKSDEVNPYAYEDNYKKDFEGNILLDENGQPTIIGGTQFEGTNPVRQYSMLDIINAGFKLEIPDTIGSTFQVFVDKEGNKYTDYAEGRNLLNTQSGQITKVTEDMAYKAIMAAFNSNPEYAASVDQDILVQDYKFRQQGTNNYRSNPNLYKNDGSTNGTLKTRDEYVRDIIDPAARRLAYVKSTQTISAATANQSTIFKGGQGTPTIQDAGAGIVVTSDSAREETVTNPAGEVMNWYEAMQGNVDDIISSYGLSYGG